MNRQIKGVLVSTATAGFLVVAGMGGAAAAEKPKPAAATAQFPTAATACQLCFTCGGDWPIFSGAWNVSNGATTERTSGCQGALISRTDFSPFLCCTD